MLSTVYGFGNKKINMENELAHANLNFKTLRLIEIDDLNGF